MGDTFHEYAHELYSRNFLNCAQRHALVMLEARDVPVTQLFDTCQISTDVILEQCIRQRVPKYDFSYDGLSDADFARVGVQRQSHFIDSFAEARVSVLDHIARDGFVLLAGDVFYFPHCPEYRNGHLFHLVILTGYDVETGLWQMIDDSPASVMCHYSYPDADVAAFYDNNSVREFRSYRQGKPCTDTPQFDRFIKSREAHTDSFTLLEKMGGLLESPWNDRQTLYLQLSQAASLLSGSRRCLAAWLRDVAKDDVLATEADDIADTAIKLRDTFVRSGLTKRLSVPRITERSQALAQAEQSLTHSIDSYANNISERTNP